LLYKKRNVRAHIRTDSNKLYNYMLRLSLLDRMAEYKKRDHDSRPKIDKG
jgi:hypothetical protein